MSQPPVDPERIADETARRLLERATALDTDGPTLAQLRQAAAESGISNAAFDAAVAEWRAESTSLTGRATPRHWAEQALRNGAALVAGWFTTVGLAAAQQLAGAPWLVHKLTDPVGMAIGAFIAFRLRARTATVVLGGLAVSQGAEFLMDLVSGAPAIHGFGAHMALMMAGVAGVAVGRAVWGRRSGPGASDSDARVTTDLLAPSDTSPSGSGDVMKAEADERFMEGVRLRRGVYVTRLQLG